MDARVERMGIRLCLVLFTLGGLLGIGSLWKIYSEPVTALAEVKEIRATSSITGIPRYGYMRWTESYLVVFQVGADEVRVNSKEILRRLQGRKGESVRVRYRAVNDLASSLLGAAPHAYEFVELVGE